MSRANTPSFRMILRATSCSAALAAALAGCATSYSPQGLQTGTSVNEAIAALGPATARYARDGGERVEFARGPYGRHTFMLDFDSQGRLTGWEQVLTEQKFDAVREGESRDQVLFALGHPSDSRPLPVQHRTLWSYRYDAVFCKWFQVGIDVNGKVADTGYGPDPLCDDVKSVDPR